jgi:putative flavoprotein involved in K+ transport
VTNRYDLAEWRRHSGAGAESIETIVIGGGQAGLSVGYYLARLGRPFVILDANERTGDSWRNRWDSLLLFTPARINGLPGMRFPAPGGTFVTKDEVADYLEAYAARFALPIRRRTTVDRLTRDGDKFVVSAGIHRFEADNVVVAMANYQTPRVPHYARNLDPGIVQLHSHEYRNPSQLQDGGVLVVGAGNSGADIALEVARSHPTWMAGEESAHVPFRIETFVARHLLFRMVRFVGHRILTVDTPIGRKIRPKALASPAPLVRVKPKDLVAAGIERVPRVVGVRGGLPVIEGERYLDVANVIWCTGYRPGFSWIDLPVLGDRGEPRHDRGIVPGEPGLYFVGLRFLYAATSDTITGVQRDARRIAKHVASPRQGTGSVPDAPVQARSA